MIKNLTNIFLFFINIRSDDRQFCPKVSRKYGYHIHQACYRPYPSNVMKILQNTCSAICHRAHLEANRDENVGNKSLRYSAADPLYARLGLNRLNVFCKKIPIIPVEPHRTYSSHRTKRLSPAGNPTHLRIAFRRTYDARIRRRRTRGGTGSGSGGTRSSRDSCGT